MQTEISKAIEAALADLGIEDVSFVVDHPTDKNTTADYFSNVALVAAKVVGKPPRDVAHEIKEKLADTIPLVPAIEVAGPGFLNLTLERSFFKTMVEAAREADTAWGTNTSLESEMVLVEYTSPNLFKPLHIGNLVGNIIGESLTRLFEANGATVKRLNYPSDIGLTVAKAVWGVQSTGTNPENIEALGAAYKAGSEAYDNDPTAKEAIDTLNQALYAGEDEVLMEIRAKGIATSKAKLAAICARLGTTFDAEIFESEVGPIGKEIVEANIGEVFEESDGAVVYRGEKAGLHTRVFLNSKRLPTYEAKDLGNFTRKEALFSDWTTSVVVTGNEQSEYFKVLYAAINELYPETTKKNLEHIATGFLTLTTGKMSSRKGNVLTGESLLEEMETAAKDRAEESRADNIAELAEQIAVAALKYQILRQHVGGDIVFDKEKSLSFEGDSGPYLQYTFARIHSLLAKAAEAGVTPDTSTAPDTAYEVEKLIYQYPEIIKTSLTERSPHKLVHFLTELAGAFNSFYAQEKIADASESYAPYKAAVADAVRLTLKNGLTVLGVQAPERM